MRKISKKRFLRLCKRWLKQADIDYTKENQPVSTSVIMRAKGWKKHLLGLSEYEMYEFVRKNLK